MAVQVQFTDHSGEVLAKMKGNVEKALSALGAEAVAQIKEQMEHASLWRAIYILFPRHCRTALVADLRFAAFLYLKNEYPQVPCACKFNQENIFP